MISYKHYSFDLWMTLIKSDPAFKIERAIFFHKNFNAKKKTQNEVINIFRQVDLLCNAINEKTGKNIDSDEMNLMVISMMNNYESSYLNIDLKWLYDETELMVLKHLPLIFCNKTISTLFKLKEQNNCSFNILSNTAFIKGITLRKVLCNLGLGNFFDFQLYSDETGLSKPNKYFFEIMLFEIKQINANKNITLNEIVHIGDNLKADIEGAAAFGIKGIQINSNSSTILSLLN